MQSLLRYGFWIAVRLMVLGIAHAGYKTYLEMQPAIVNAEAARKAIEVLVPASAPCLPTQLIARRQTTYGAAMPSDVDAHELGADPRIEIKH